MATTEEFILDENNNKIGKRISTPDTVWTADLEDEYHSFDGKPSFIDGIRSKTRLFISYHKHGLRHRLDGPAVIDIDSEERYYINGIQYHTPLEYWTAVENYKHNTPNY